jgi:kynurenine formamidase
MDNGEDLVRTLAAVLGRHRMVDLSHLLEPGIPSWPTHPKLCHNLMESYRLGDVSCHYQLTMSEHSGTHFDAPLHFIEGGKGIEALPLGSFIGRLATIQATDIEPCGLVGRSRIEAFEERHGGIEPGDAVLFHFGWDQLWKKRPDERAFLKDWPGLGREAAEYLAARKVRMVGCDALSIDAYTSTDFPAHHTFLGADILIGENFTNLGRLPPFSTLAAFPLPIKGGSGSPVRAVAFVPPASGTAA